MALAIALASVPTSAAVLLKGGNASDGMALDPVSTVFALDVGHRFPPFQTVQGVTFAGGADPYIGGPGPIGGFFGEFTGTFGWPKASSTADDVSLAEVAKILYFSVQGIDWTVSHLAPGGLYRVEIIESPTISH